MCDTGVYTGSVCPAPIELALPRVFRFCMGVYRRTFTGQSRRWVELHFRPDFVMLWLLHTPNDTPGEKKTLRICQHAFWYSCKTYNACTHLMYLHL